MVKTRAIAQVFDRLIYRFRFLSLTLNFKPIYDEKKVSAPFEVQLERYRQRMVVNHFSDSTIKGYTYVIKRLQAFHNLPIEQLTEFQLVAFICHLKEGLNLSSATMRINVGAIKYFYRHVLNRKALCDKIPYPKKEKFIRTYLTGAEIRRLFEHTPNLKYRLILKLAYSAGLRRSEILNLRIGDFDWINMQLLVRQGKGNKDRYTILAQSIKSDFNQYIQDYNPQEYLFSGYDKSRPFSQSSICRVFALSTKRASISKPGLCLHSLRHSFASHLLAIHTDVVTVQKLMGHVNIQTTMDYFHLGNRPDARPKSPIDIIYPSHNDDNRPYYS